jgi:hypothetical protein
VVGGVVESVVVLSLGGRWCGWFLGVGRGCSNVATARGAVSPLGNSHCSLALFCVGEERRGAGGAGERRRRGHTLRLASMLARSARQQESLPIAGTRIYKLAPPRVLSTCMYE